MARRHGPGNAHAHHVRRLQPRSRVDSRWQRRGVRLEAGPVRVRHLSPARGRPGAGRTALGQPTPIRPDPQSWSPDGRTLVFSTKAKDTAEDIWTLRSRVTAPRNRGCRRLATSGPGASLPDGRWMAYNPRVRAARSVCPAVSRTRRQVARFPGGRGFNAISSRDGRRLYFRRGDQVLEADVDTASGFTLARPGCSFPAATWPPDGISIVTRRNALRDDAQRRFEEHLDMHVVLNWWHALEARANAR